MHLIFPVKWALDIISLFLKFVSFVSYEINVYIIYKLRFLEELTLLSTFSL